MQPTTHDGRLSIHDRAVLCRRIPKFKVRAAKMPLLERGQHGEICLQETAVFVDQDGDISDEFLVSLPSGLLVRLRPAE